jgi:hypothetical protein
LILNNNHFFISTWGSGLLEFENNRIIKNYTDLNSQLQNIIPGSPYVRICGMAIDNKGYLWLSQPEVSSTIKALKPDGTWIVNPVSVSAATVGDLIITKSGHKWVLLPRVAEFLSWMTMIHPNLSLMIPIKKCL